MTYTPEQVASLIAMLRSLPGFEHLPDTDLAVRAADALEAEHRRAEEAEAACETLEHECVEHHVRHAEWVERAEAERDRYLAAIKEALESLSENEDRDKVVIGIHSRALGETDTASWDIPIDLPADGDHS
ncbi:MULTISPECIES: hypothetical protein [Bacteria]|uniref:Uncharacterized protein n=1 Tax=Microbacterium phage Min1 TaxID=446529 RepID=A6N1Z0_9CAUD|nr:hypothetical protein MPMin1_gp32 [Microbacterium phage Min1]ABR10462.1 hypothetical protein [Microbacterium phage Min1]